MKVAVMPDLPVYEGTFQNSEYIAKRSDIFSSCLAEEKMNLLIMIYFEAVCLNFEHVVRYVNKVNVGVFQRKLLFTCLHLLGNSDCYSVW